MLERTESEYSELPYNVEFALVKLFENEVSGLGRIEE